MRHLQQSSMTNSCDQLTDAQMTDTRAISVLSSANAGSKNFFHFKFRKLDSKCSGVCIYSNLNLITSHTDFEQHATYDTCVTTPYFISRETKKRPFTCFKKRNDNGTKINFSADFQHHRAIYCVLVVKNLSTVY